MIACPIDTWFAVSPYNYRMQTQAEKAKRFQELHRRPGAFLIPNPWDVGSARLLARLGFEALATTSVGYAFSVGRRDHGVSRDEMIAHAAAIVAATERSMLNGPADSGTIILPSAGSNQHWQFMHIL